MEKVLKTGMTHQTSFVVESKHCASALGSGALDVLATPWMIARMENAAMLCVADGLEEGADTVGTLVQITHDAATPIGMKVTICAELKEIDKRRLIFDVSAHDERGPIGQGRHERYIVDRKRFMAKVNEK